MNFILRGYDFVANHHCLIIKLLPCDKFRPEMLAQFSLEGLNIALRQVNLPNQLIDFQAVILSFGYRFCHFIQSIKKSHATFLLRYLLLYLISLFFLKFLFLSAFFPHEKPKFFHIK